MDNVIFICKECLTVRYINHGGSRTKRQRALTNSPVARCVRDGADVSFCPFTAAYGGATKQGEFDLAGRGKRAAHSIEWWYLRDDVTSAVLPGLGFAKGDAISATECLAKAMMRRMAQGGLLIDLSDVSCGLRRLYLNLPPTRVRDPPAWNEYVGCFAVPNFESMRRHP
jgi:hypothetical protein